MPLIVFNIEWMGAESFICLKISTNHKKIARQKTKSKKKKRPRKEGREHSIHYATKYGRVKRHNDLIMTIEDSDEVEVMDEDEESMMMKTLQACVRAGSYLKVFMMMMMMMMMVMVMVILKKKRALPQERPRQKEQRGCEVVGLYGCHGRLGKTR